jgi:hypothetical protein
MIRSACTLILAGLVLAGCATLPPEPPAPAVTAFSAAPPGEAFPGGWRPMKLSRFKKSTGYRLVNQDGRTVVHAHADSAASGLVHDVDVDPQEFPQLRWRWKVPALIRGADNSAPHTEDSPGRVIVTFSGDKSRWDFSDRLFATQVRMMTGHEMPYATLVYIWENRASPETVIPNAHTSRVKMIVVRSGAERVGHWCEEARNVRDDYRRAFGEEPGRITSIGVMTDSDNTGQVAQAFYGDIAFSGRRPR